MVEGRVGGKEREGVGWRDKVSERLGMLDGLGGNWWEGRASGWEGESVVCGWVAWEGTLVGGFG